MCTEDLDDSLVPDEIILLPAESAEVNFALHLNKDRLDLLHKQNPQKEIFLVNKLTVFWGCESTRLRLKKFVFIVFIKIIFHFKIVCKLFYLIIFNV